MRGNMCPAGDCEAREAWAANVNASTRLVGADPLAESTGELLLGGLGRKTRAPLLPSDVTPRIDLMAYKITPLSRLGQ